ncbi:MAG: hypothetical protein HWD61_06835 [Parachlamydiaceae bacterium]|nr:MAG: hypothetical protein HWD61_06835 [Parachlamydiaceae bacterium]
MDYVELRYSAIITSFEDFDPFAKAGFKRIWFAQGVYASTFEWSNPDKTWNIVDKTDTLPENYKKTRMKPKESIIKNTSRLTSPDNNNCNDAIE